MSVGVSFNMEMNLDIEDLLVEEADALYKLGDSPDYRKLLLSPEQIDFIENVMSPEHCFDVLYWFVDGLYFPNLVKSSTYIYSFEIKNEFNPEYWKERYSKIKTINGLIHTAFSTYNGEKYILDHNVCTLPNRYRPDDAMLNLLKYFLESRTTHKLRCNVIEVPASTKRWEGSYPVFNVKRGYTRG